MSSKPRPRRSVLYMPGANTRALEKARSLPADGLILDLEDAVAPDAKALAREQVAAAVRVGGYGPREVIVRVNCLDTVWGRDDVAAVANCGADAVLFPKVERPDQVRDAVAALDAAGAPADLAVWIMAETPRAFLEINAIAAAHPRLKAIVIGTSDLAKELRARHTPDRIGMIGALSLGVLAARAYGLTILDGVYLDLNDEAGLQQACRQGRDMGFDGKTLIHPKQIDAANAMFAPDMQEVADARQLIAAWQDARDAGQGVVVVNGKLVENLHVEEALRILTLADAIATMG